MDAIEDAEGGPMVIEECLEAIEHRNRALLQLCLGLDTAVSEMAGRLKTLREATVAYLAES